MNMDDDDDDYEAHAFMKGLIVGLAVSAWMWALGILIAVLI